MNFDFVTDRLAIGTTPESQLDLIKLTCEGTTHIIDCRVEVDITPLIQSYPNRLQYLFNGTLDWDPLKPEHKPLAWFRAGVEFALSALTVPRNKVYVFCHMGANRSATMAWAILRALGLTTSECFAVIDSHRAIDIPGLLECGWWRDAEVALRTLGYI